MRLTWVTPPPTKRFIPRLRMQASKYALDIAKAVWQGAVDRTPVASGELRASWNLSFGAPNYSTVGDATSSPGRSVAPLPPPSMPNLKPVPLRNAKYYVSNGKEYSGYVEYGTVTIPPQMMLDRAVKAATR